MAKEWDGTRSPFDTVQVRTDGFRDCIDAIKGAILFGTNPPPEGHWLAEFWQIGRKLAASPADQAEDVRDAARYRALRKAGDVSISCDHGDYTQYVDSGEELDDLCDNYLSGGDSMSATPPAAEGK